MPEQTSELSGIIARLERVERDNRRLKRTGVVLLLSVCALVLMGQAQTARTVEAERFILKNQDGKMQAELSAENPYESSLKFYDHDGKKRTYYGNGGLQLEDQWGQGLTHIGADSFSMFFGSDAEQESVMIRASHVEISGESGSVSLGMVPTFHGGTARFASFMPTGKSAPGLILNGAYGKGFVSMNTADGPLIHMEGLLRDNQSPDAVEIAADDPRIVVEDQQGFVATMGRSQLEAKKTGKRMHTSAASVVLSGKDGVLWSAP